MDKNLLNTLTVHHLQEQIRADEIKASEILSCLNERIQELNPKINAYVRTDTVGSSNTENIPITIKDNICTKGLNTECCSKIL